MDSDGLDRWIAGLEDGVRKGGMAVSEVLQVLGRPDIVSLESANRAGTRRFVYLVRSSRLGASELVAGAVSARTMPTIEFTVVGNSVKGVERGKYSIAEVPGDGNPGAPR